jgi:hypothetical protein
MTSSLRFLAVAMLILVAACAQTQTVDFNKQTDQLIGYSEDDIIACAGLPDGSLNLESGRSALLYSQRRISVEPSPFAPFGGFGRWGSCPWGATSIWCDSPFFLDDIDVEEETCRLAFWTEAGKVVGVTGEYSPVFGQQLCRKIISPCLQVKPQTPPNSGLIPKSNI